MILFQRPRDRAEHVPNLAAGPPHAHVERMNVITDGKHRTEPIPETHTLRVPRNPIIWGMHTDTIVSLCLDGGLSIGTYAFPCFNHRGDGL